MPRLATRAQRMSPFYAVELFKQATALNAQGHDIISLGIGEPDFTAPAQVVDTLKRAAHAGLSSYTAPAGLSALRESIAHYYREAFQAPIEAQQVLVTAGASGALMLAALALVEPGDEVLMPDPSYPANQNFIHSAGGIPKLIACTPEQRFQLDAATIAQHWGPNTRGVLLASPSNPTGTCIAQDTLAELITEVRARDGFIIMDEIYLGLSYGETIKSALALDEHIVVINSFSKYFHMTGWRLGWLIAPQTLMPTLDVMAASLAICAPALSQHAAVTCFEPDVMKIYENRRLSFKQRRDYLLPELRALGFDIPVTPDGAFYIYADISAHSQNSEEFCQRLLVDAGVAVVPGHDFGPAYADHSVRFSYATGLDRLEEAVERIKRHLA